MSVGKLHRYGLPFANVVANGIATCSVTVGRTIADIKLALGGTALTKAMLSMVKVKANGKTIMEGSGSQIDRINAFRGDHTDAAFLVLPFLDVGGVMKVDRMIGAFDTSIGVQDITIEVTIAGAIAPTLKAVITEYAPQRAPSGKIAPFAGLISKIRRYPFDVSTGGQLPVKLPYGQTAGSIIKRVHIEHGGNLTDLTVKEDGLVIHEMTVAENQFEQQRWGRVPQANTYTVDFTDTGSFEEAMDTRGLRSLEWLPEFSAADNGFIMVEYLDPLGNL